MRPKLKVVAVLSACAVFYAGAFLLMQGVKDFENRGATALFTSKSEAAAIDNAVEMESRPVEPIAPQGIWK